MDDFHENLNYILQQLGIIKFHYRIYDCLGSIQTLINSSVGMESSSHDNDKKIYILHNFFTSKSNHRSLFHDIVNKYKETERVLFIIMSDEPKKMKDQSFLLGKPIKLVYKSISTQLFKPYAYNF